MMKALRRRHTEHIVRAGAWTAGITLAMSLAVASAPASAASATTATTSVSAIGPGGVHLRAWVSQASPGAPTLVVVNGGPGNSRRSGCGSGIAMSVVSSTTSAGTTSSGSTGSASLRRPRTQASGCPTKSFPSLNRKRASKRGGQPNLRAEAGVSSCCSARYDRPAPPLGGERLESRATGSPRGRWQRLASEFAQERAPSADCLDGCKGVAARSSHAAGYGFRLLRIWIAVTRSARGFVQAWCKEVPAKDVQADGVSCGSVALCPAVDSR
jgi:hypothetical protein